MDDILEQFRGYGKDVANKEEDVLGPLRRAMGRIASLSEAVNVAKAAPEEGELRDLGRKLGLAKRELMALGRDLMMSQVPTLAAKAHDLAKEAGDAIKSGQKEIKVALRRLGVASDISEAGSLDLPPSPRRPAAGGLDAQSTLQSVRPVTGPLQGTRGEVADLVRCLAVAQSAAATSSHRGGPGSNSRRVQIWAGSSPSGLKLRPASFWIPIVVKLNFSLETGLSKIVPIQF
jgi:hypothetical protein